MNTKSLFQHAQFLTSAAQLEQVPPDVGFEIAFVGRSNAGKSSVLNTICQISKLARTSKTPGRTQLLNFFDLGRQRRLVDLPGYGFAKVPAAIQARWENTLGRYIAERRSLQGLVIIMDCRHPLRVTDEQMIAWAAERGLAQLILLNKADKLPFGQRTATERALKQKLQALYGDAAPSVFLYSCLRPIGRELVFPILNQWLQF